MNAMHAPWSVLAVSARYTVSMQARASDLTDLQQASVGFDQVQEDGTKMSMQFGTQRRLLQEQAGALAQQLQRADAGLADNQQLVARLQSQQDQHSFKIHQAQDAIASKFNSRLAAAASDLAAFKLAAQQQQGRLKDANSRLQQGQSCLADRIAELEASTAAASSQLEDLQNSTMALLQAWATVMQALGVAWEQPTNADVPSFMMALQRAQQAALGRLKQLGDEDLAEQVRLALNQQAFGLVMY